MGEALLEFLTGLIVEVRKLPNGAVWLGFIRNKVATKIQVRITGLKGDPMAQSPITMNTLQKVTLHAKAVDANGSPAPIDGKIDWLVDVNGVVALFPSSDGTSCDVVGKVGGVCNVKPQADSDLTAGITLIFGDPTQFTITAAPAVKLEVTADPVVSQ